MFFWIVCKLGFVLRNNSGGKVSIVLLVAPEGYGRSIGQLVATMLFLSLHLLIRYNTIDQIIKVSNTRTKKYFGHKGIFSGMWFMKNPNWLCCIRYAVFRQIFWVNLETCGVDTANILSQITLIIFLHICYLVVVIVLLVTGW